MNTTLQSRNQLATKAAIEARLDAAPVSLTDQLKADRDEKIAKQRLAREKER
ncbi:MAG: hypothetical protein ACR2O1_10200 [Boseongicola sp.]